MSEKDNLYNNILNWISNNQDKVIIAQQIAKKIDELKLINSLSFIFSLYISKTNKGDLFKSSYSLYLSILLFK